MTDQLREALRDLADEARVMSPPDDAWTKGRRSRRRWQLTAVGFATAVAALGGSVVWGTMAPPSGPDVATPPSYDAADLHIPDGIWKPSPWLSGTEDDGPLGPLAVIGTVNDRHTSWLHSERAVYGVSALTGEYRYLDLPDAELDPRATVALSPDGTQIAYLYSGKPEQQPRFHVIGLAVYNTPTGTVKKYQIDNKVGLDLSRNLGPRWSTDGSYVYMRATSSYLGSHFPRTAKAVVLNLVTGVIRMRSIPFSLGFDHWVAGPAFRTPTGIIARFDDLPGAPRAERWGGFAVSPGGTTAAFATQGPDGNGHQTTRLYVAPMPKEPNGISKAELVQPPVSFDSISGWVLGWSDDSHVVGVLGGNPLTGTPRDGCICSVDIESGALETYIESSEDIATLQPQFATDLLTRAQANRDAPRDPVDPRVLALAGALLVIGAMLLIWGWHRHRRKHRQADDFARSIE
ncbi:MAG: hypothetical protein ABJA81_07720 [Nocardioidaceae bacterium]